MATDVAASLPDMPPWDKALRRGVQGNLKKISRSASEPALTDQNGVARADRGAQRHDGADRAACIGMGQRYAVPPSAGREAAGNGDRAFDAHVWHVGIL